MTSTWHKILNWSLVFQQGGYNIRMKATHFLNAAPFTSALISMVKFALKRKLADRVSASYTLHTLHTAITTLVAFYFFHSTFWTSFHFCPTLQNINILHFSHLPAVVIKVRSKHFVTMSSVLCLFSSLICTSNKCVSRVLGWIKSYDICVGFVFWGPRFSALICTLL